MNTLDYPSQPWLNRQVFPSGPSQILKLVNGNPELATLIPLAQYLKISLDAIIHEAPLETDHTTYQILEELQNCSEEDRLIALRTLRELLAALKEKDQINKPHF